MKKKHLVILNLENLILITRAMSVYSQGSAMYRFVHIESSVLQVKYTKVLKILGNIERAK